MIMEEKTLQEQLEELKAAVRDYLKHPSEDGSPLRREKRRKLAKMVEDEGHD